MNARSFACSASLASAITAALVTSACSLAQAQSILEAEVVVFGATPGGIAAAVAAARTGRSVRLLEPSARIGGMVSGGLSNTDTGGRGAGVISGIAGEFFARVRRIENDRGACARDCDTTFFFEPHVGELVFEQMLVESGVALERSTELVRVEKNGATIMTLTTSRGVVQGDVYIDASYEGDLMALAGVPYSLGREARVFAAEGDASGLAQQEDLAGVQPLQLPLGAYVDPYRVPGDPASGTIRYIDPRPDPLPEPGSADHRVMPFTYRLCVTDDPSNRIPFRRPDGYDPADFEMHARLAAAAPPDVNIVRGMFNPAPMTLSRDRQYFKYDLNSTLTLSTELTGDGLNHVYTERSAAGREEIRRTYRRYIESLLYAWQTEPRFSALHARVSQFGYCADEFTDNGGFSYQFYVRAGRRMTGEYVMNQNDVMQNGRRAPVEDGVALGTYGLAAHSHRYVAAPVIWPDGGMRDAIMIERWLIGGLPDDRPYPIAYASLTPRREDATNLLNPVTISATSVAYSAIRMEPTFMMLGEAAGMAAVLAIDEGTAVQAVPYATLRQRLEANGLKLSAP